jgi:gamma-glutamylcyclotransferase (GGCT)/AIG2-like uncharacterized protein YtfP
MRRNPPPTPAGGSHYIGTRNPRKPAINPHLMQIGPLAIFVYGTLQRGQVRERCWPRPAIRVEPATVRGWLFNLGPYPALVVPAAGEAADTIAGELRHMAADDLDITLAALDRIEGFQDKRNDLYRRVEIVCEAADRQVPAWIYEYARAIGPDDPRRVLPHDERACRWPEQNAR